LASTTWGSAGFKLLINGDVEDSDVDTADWGNGTIRDFYVGVSNWEGGNSFNWDGVIDEIRLSTSQRAAAWEKATYNSLLDTLLTYGSEETEEEEEANAIFFGTNF